MTEAPTSQHLNSTVCNDTKGGTHPTVTEAPLDRNEHLTDAERAGANSIYQAPPSGLGTKLGWNSVPTKA